VLDEFPASSPPGRLAFLFGFMVNQLTQVNDRIVKAPRLEYVAVRPRQLVSLSLQRKNA
jgi:hypothetical protein